MNKYNTGFLYIFIIIFIISIFYLSYRFIDSYLYYNIFNCGTALIECGNSYYSLFSSLILSIIIGYILFKLFNKFSK